VSNFYLCCNYAISDSRRTISAPKRQEAARCHHDDVAGEEPLFIDPGKDEPTEYIGFRAEYAFALKDNDRARATIESLGLNRMPWSSSVVRG